MDRYLNMLRYGAPIERQHVRQGRTACSIDIRGRPPKAADTYWKNSLPLWALHQQLFPSHNTSSSRTPGRLEGWVISVVAHLESRFPPLNTSMKRSSGDSGAPSRVTMCIGMPACTGDGGWVACNTGIMLTHPCLCFRQVDAAQALPEQERQGFRLKEPSSNSIMIGLPCRKHLPHCKRQVL